MKKVIILLLLFFAVSLPVSSIAKENTIKTQLANSDDYIYVKVNRNGKIFVYVYLSDGITLVNVYEEED